MTTITVGCKLPHGLLLEVEGKKVQVAGANRARIAGGCGMTENVDEQFFAEWMRRNAGLQFVKNGLIFGFAKTEEANAFAQLAESTPTGFERLDPEAMPALLEPTEDQQKLLDKKSGSGKSGGKSGGKK